MGDSDFDVFLSHSSRDKTVVRKLAERLRSDGVRVWFDEWEILPGDSIPARIEEGLEASRVLVLCLSANALGSEWAALEAGTFRFRDPLNRERRFIPLRLDETPARGSLAQLLYISWQVDRREEEYPKLLTACRPPVQRTRVGELNLVELRATLETRLDRRTQLNSVRFSSDCSTFIAASEDTTVRRFEVESGRCLQTFGSELTGHKGAVQDVAWSPDQKYVVSGSREGTLRLWKVDEPDIPLVLEGSGHDVECVAWSVNGRWVAAGDARGDLHVWDITEALEVDRGIRGIRPHFKSETAFHGHNSGVWGLAWASNPDRLLSVSHDQTLRVWSVSERRSLRVFEGHEGPIATVACTTDGRWGVTGSHDKTLRVWDIEAGLCVQVLEGHKGPVGAVSITPDGQYILSGAEDATVRVWDWSAGECVDVLTGHEHSVRGVAWSADLTTVYATDSGGSTRVWHLRPGWANGRAPDRQPDLRSPEAPAQVLYTNAKVLLVGESSAGKTGLSMRLALDEWSPSESTLGAWATHWKLPVSSGDGTSREIWLWDFGGQADQRLIHQLYMDETALAVLVFDGQKQDVFETLGQWDRDLARASAKPFTKLLAAGRVDVGGLRVSKAQLATFADERGFSGLFETSARTGVGCSDLRQAIIDGIKWDEIPWRSSPVLFKRLKDAILELKDDGHVLMRVNELRTALQFRVGTAEAGFTDRELEAVIRLLAGPGIVWELSFGSWILLQPERLNLYAQAVIQTLRADEFERGCIAESRVLEGDLDYQAEEQRLPPDEERFVLLAMHQTLVARGLCIREHTDQGPLLIFPSYYRRERPELIGHPAVHVSYRLSGFLDDIYATLVVRLQHLEAFEREELWRYAADFRTVTGKQLGIKLTRLSEGAGELDVYFDPSVSIEEKIIFSRYIHEHLSERAQDIVRLRHYVCSNCGTVVGNREVAMRRLAEWQSARSQPQAPNARRRDAKPTIICANCERRVPLWDELEQHFSAPEMEQRVEAMLHRSALILDNESKERALVGEVVSTVALAGQICREVSVSDHGIDMEVEFKNDEGHATGTKLYLQLKSGDSHLQRRKRDNAEVFRIRDKRHADYWMSQVFPVFLVVRDSAGNVRWMEIRDELRRRHERGETLNQLVYEGERFDVMSVRRWRDRALSAR